MKKETFLYSLILIGVLIAGILYVIGLGLDNNQINLAATPIRLPHEIEPLRPESDPAAPAPIDPDACEDEYWDKIDQCEDDRDFDEAVCDGEFAACMENFPGLPMFGLLFCGPEKETCYGDAGSHYRACVCEATMEAMVCLGENPPGGLPGQIALCILLWPPDVPPFHPAPEPDPNRFTV